MSTKTLITDVAQLNNGHRSALSSKWNSGFDLMETARACGVTVDVAEAYLKTRYGYPGKVGQSRPPRDPGRCRKAHHLTHEHRQPVTLPRISCLESKEQ